MELSSPESRQILSGSNRISSFVGNGCIGGCKGGCEVKVGVEVDKVFILVVSGSGLLPFDLGVSVEHVAALSSIDILMNLKRL